jgi:hypothetical protein
MQTWSSFPIRYAHRRELLATGPLASTAGSAAPSSALLRPDPAGAAPSGDTIAAKSHNGTRRIALSGIQSDAVA